MPAPEKAARDAPPSPNPRRPATAYDIIGDIHGQDEKLVHLLQHLGYHHRDGVWRHSSRTAIFVGDLIDRGPGQRRTLRIVRAMVEAGTARATMGNHEFNAIAWATPHPHRPGDHLRTRLGEKGARNRSQHGVFLSDVGEDSAEHAQWIEWMRTLPLWIEEPDFRVVHACWSARHVDLIRPHLAEGNRTTPALIAAASEKGSALHEAIEMVLKGEELTLPGGAHFHDKDGNRRHEVRARWWNPSLATYRAAAFGAGSESAPDVPIAGRKPIPEPDRPTFIGHYWLPGHETPAPCSPRVACVDYSAGKSGPLTAYRFDGEAVLSADKFVQAGAA